MKRILWLIALLWASFAVGAQTEPERKSILADVTVSTQVSILEVDCEDELKARVKEAQALGLFEAEYKKVLGTMRRLATHPESLGFRESTSNEVRTHVLTQLQGLRRLHEVNALLKTFQRTYVFVDLEKEEQQQWLFSYLKQKEKRRAPTEAHERIVAVGGHLQRNAKALQRRIYFDQMGRLSSRLGVKSVPSVVKVFIEKEALTARIETFAVTKADKAKKFTQGGEDALQPTNTEKNQ